MMRYYPVNLDITNQQCLVVGGGAVGTRKVKGLLNCGAKVRVVSPENTPEIQRLAKEDLIELHQRNYRSKDIEGVFLVIGATDDETLNRQIHADAGARNILCNIADRPEICNFILPALVQQGDMVIAISTSGKSPAFAKHLKREIQRDYGPEYGRFLDLMGAIRKKLLVQEHAPEEHKPLFESLIRQGLLDLVRKEDVGAIDRLLASVLGLGFHYNELMKTKLMKTGATESEDG